MVVFFLVIGTLASASTVAVAVVVHCALNTFDADYSEGLRVEEVEPPVY